jgi:hypothetical protein
LPGAGLQTESGWLARTHSELLDARGAGAEPRARAPWYALPAVLAVLYLAVMAFLNLYVLW